MTEGDYTPDRVSAEPNAALVMIFAATGLTLIIILERRMDLSLLDIFAQECKKCKERVAGWKTVE
jgi:hypothetical protein